MAGALNFEETRTPARAVSFIIKPCTQASLIVPSCTSWARPRARVGMRCTHVPTRTRHTGHVAARASFGLLFRIKRDYVRYVTLHSTCPAGPHTLTSYSCSISFHECESRVLAPHKRNSTQVRIYMRTVFRVRRGAYSRVQRAVHRDASPLHAARCARHAHAPLLSLSSRFSASTCYLEFELMPLAVAPIELSERGRSGTRHTVAGPRNRRKRSGGRTAPRRATWG